MDSLTELFLYFASRAQHTVEKIKPALKSGKAVISDRYFDSTLAYQGEGRNIPNQKIAEINSFATGGLIPVLTFLIDVPAEIGMNRLTTKDRIEKESLEFHNRVRGSFLTIARENKERIKIIDGMRPIEEIRKEIASIVLNYI
jgi:dTMP kinase